jgi:PleD family two-component response regulator
LHALAQQFATKMLKSDYNDHGWSLSAPKGDYDVPAHFAAHVNLSQQPPPIPPLCEKEAARVVPQIVIVHGDEQERTLLGSILKKRGYTVKALDTSAGVDEFSQSTPDCILIQHCPDRGSCTELVRVIRKRRELADVPVIMLSPGARNNELAEVLDAGANVFLLNPFGESELIALLQSQLRAHENNTGLKHQLERTQQALVRLQADLALG